MDARQPPRAGLVDNHWHREAGDLHFTEAPPEQLRGATGCVLNQGVFDGAVGPETYLVILEAGENAREVASTRPFRIFCKAGVARTDHGLVAFLLWEVRDAPEMVAWYEHFVDPYNEEALLLLEEAGRQTHFKVVVYDSLRSRVVDWFEFENIFRLGEFGAWLREIRGRYGPGDFVAAQADFVSEHNIEEVLEFPSER